MKFLIALILVIAVYSDPLPPKWPPVFFQDFHEVNTYPVVGDFHTDGQFYYDATTQRYRVDRANGKGDRYCWLHGWNVLFNQACSHIVVDGKRYLYYPEQNSCCYCCGTEHGCGLLSQNWLHDATFVGEVELNGQKAFQWDKQGLQSNFYYETVADEPLERIQLQTNQGTNDAMTFDKDSYSTYMPNGHLDLPNVCKNAGYCATLSTCTAARLGQFGVAGVGKAIGNYLKSIF